MRGQGAASGGSEKMGIALATPNLRSAVAAEQVRLQIPSRPDWIVVGEDVNSINRIAAQAIVAGSRGSVAPALRDLVTTCLTFCASSFDITSSAATYLRPIERTIRTTLAAINVGWREPEKSNG